jgi:hypothetical protein
MVETRGIGLLLIGAVIGLVVGGPVGAVLAPNSAVSSSDSTPSTTYSSSSGCFDGPQESDGWLYVAANGEAWTVSLNATVVHPRGAKIDLNVSQRPTGVYEIELITNDTATDEPYSNEDCRVATTVDIATSLPKPDFVVSLNGRIVRSVNQDETVANLYPIPNPLNVTERAATSTKSSAELVQSSF